MLGAPRRCERRPRARENVCLGSNFCELCHAQARIEKAFLLTGPNAYESALLGLMERIVAEYPDLRLFSLPSLQGQERRHLELGVEGAPEQVEQAMVDIRREIEQRGITWRWRDQAGSDSL